MLNEPLDILSLHPIRRSTQQKEAFRVAVARYMSGLGYELHRESCGKDGQNLVFGNQEGARYLVCAHYDTPSTIGIPNVCVPCSAVRSRLTFFSSMFLSAGMSAGAALLLKNGHLILGLILVFAILGLLLLLCLAPANRNNANDNTSGLVTLLEIARTLPEKHRNKVCFVLFDLEELGVKGSADYRKAHKAITENQIILNLDCVGDGDHILLMPNQTLRKDPKFIGRLKYLGGWFGRKQILTIDRGFCRYNSDHKHFPKSVAIAAFHKKGKNYVLDKIHTKHDTNLDITNVNLLRAALTTLICGEAVK